MYLFVTFPLEWKRVSDWRQPDSLQLQERAGVQTPTMEERRVCCPTLLWESEAVAPSADKDTTRVQDKELNCFQP